jgi:hypothetical protein
MMKYVIQNTSHDTLGRVNRLRFMLCIRPTLPPNPPRFLELFVQRLADEL